MGSNYELSYNINAYLSDSVLTSSSLSRVVMHPAQGDMSVSVGFGPQDGTWQISGYVRNILEATAIYQPEFDFVPSGYVSYRGIRNQFRYYGVKFNYNFQ